MAVKRPAVGSMGLPLGVAGVDPSWSLKWPALCGHLFDLKYDDGTERQTSTLMLLSELGVVKACLNDRDVSRSAWVSGRTVDECLEALESGLVADSLDWRVKPAGWKGKKGK